ncbi:YadA-like family protein [Candidatus Mycalebacterium sp.]
MQLSDLMKAGAAVTAISSIPTVAASGRRVSVGLGVKYFEGEGAAAAGLAIAVQDRLHINVASSFADEKPRTRFGAILEF